MPWGVTQTYAVSWDDYQRVVEVLGEDPPDGLYFYAAGPEAEGTRIMSVWDSAESYEAFRERHLRPTAALMLGADVPDGPMSHMPLDVQHFLIAHAMTPVSHRIAFY
jgi:hypothetical protein